MHRQHLRTFRSCRRARVVLRSEPRDRRPGRPSSRLAGAWQGRGMADGSVHRAVTVERIAPGVFTATNARGGQLRFGTGSDTGFTPTELLLAAIAGCTAIDVDILTSRRAEPDSFGVRAGADKV